MKIQQFLRSVFLVIISIGSFECKAQLNPPPHNTVTVQLERTRTRILLAPDWCVMPASKLGPIKKALSGNRVIMEAGTCDDLRRVLKTRVGSVKHSMLVVQDEESLTTKIRDSPEANRRFCIEGLGAQTEKSLEEARADMEKLKMPVQGEGTVPVGSLVFSPNAVYREMFGVAHRVSGRDRVAMDQVVSCTMLRGEPVMFEFVYSTPFDAPPASIKGVMEQALSDAKKMTEAMVSANGLLSASQGSSNHRTKVRRK